VAVTIRALASLPYAAAFTALCLQRATYDARARAPWRRATRHRSQTEAATQQAAASGGVAQDDRAVTEQPPLPRNK